VFRNSKLVGFGKRWEDVRSKVGGVDSDPKLREIDDQGVLFGSTDEVVGGAKSEIKVLGRQVDTHVAKNWKGHDVLDIPDWTLKKNDAWVQAGIKNRQKFYLSSPTKGNMIQTSGPFKGQPTIFSRELNMLKDAGYVRSGDYFVPPSR